MFARMKEALAVRASQSLMEQLPVSPVKLQWAARLLEPKNIKRIAVVAVGGSVALSLIGTISRNRLYRIAVAKELKKQLAPIQKQLDELNEQNEVLRRQNEALQEQLAKE